MSIVTRFAPSPTGMLHIGGARTALFNWLFARHHGGTFLLRIEDTDRARSTAAAVDAILEGLSWLGLDWDQPPLFQFARADHHAALARSLVQSGRAYHCYASPEELEVMRAKALAEGRTVAYDRRWRDRDPADAPAGVAPVIRVKAPLSGEMTIEDAVQGRVTLQADALDDLIILRADGTPTYNLAVVIDDHDMGITHVIRGDDHVNNAFRQRIIYEAFSWPLPVFAHVPMIHGQDGAKLSKRHGATGAQEYRDQGFLPEALRNYLLRLGWSHGDEELIDTDRAISLFSLDGIGRAPARLDLAKLRHVNAHYLRQAQPARLVALLLPRLTARLGRPPDAAAQARLQAGLPMLLPRAETLIDLAEAALFLVHPLPLPLEEPAAALLARPGVPALLHAVADLLPTWGEAETAIEAALKALAKERALKMPDLMQPLRAALTGRLTAPEVAALIAALGPEASMSRLRYAASHEAPLHDPAG